MKKENSKTLFEIFGINPNDRYIYIPEMNIHATVKKQNGMTVITGVNDKFRRMLVDQNECWLLEWCSGSLLDNMLYQQSEKGGYMAFYETYLNSWNSCYTVYFSRDFKVLEKFYSDFDGEMEEKEEINNMSIENYL